MIAISKWACTAAVSLTCVFTTAALASEPATRLVRCASDNCLLITGHRDNAAWPVQINGHPVTVEGGRSWRVRLPVATVRSWSAPFARRIEVSSVDQAGQQVSARQAGLPIGLLGHVPDLAELVITLH